MDHGGGLSARIAGALERDIHPDIAAFAAALGSEAQALAVLFYGSNLRTGALDGVLDFYILLPGPPERGIWPRVTYRERPANGAVLRAKLATMSLATFEHAAAGDSVDTTIWSRFAQPSALAWQRGEGERLRVMAAVERAVITAAALAAALGPEEASEAEFWRGLFKATYHAEFRVERPGREAEIVAAHAHHFRGLLAPALAAAGIACAQHGDGQRPQLPAAERRRILARWKRRRRLGKLLNVARLVRAAGTFDGAARYAAWKIERHTGHAVKITAWQERHPVLAAPGVLWGLWRDRSRAAPGDARQR